MRTMTQREFLATLYIPSIAGEKDGSGRKIKYGSNILEGGGRLDGTWFSSKAEAVEFFKQLIADKDERVMNV